MSVQDGLLSFQISETIFLSSDKAGIQEITELELLPDITIIESSHDISISGCLQLRGKYRPTGNASTTSEGETDTLVSAMQFTPFVLEKGETSECLYNQDVDLTHRIPLSISIPQNRIADIREVYGIVDSFDYEVKNPSHLQIQAELKISGIQLQAEATEVEEKQEEAWEFVHVANHPEQQQDFQPVSIDEIERKLAALEQAVEEQEAAYDQPTPLSYQSSLYPPAPPSYLTTPPVYPTVTNGLQQEQEMSYAQAFFTPEKATSEEVAEQEAPVVSEATEATDENNLIDFQAVYDNRQADVQTIVAEEEEVFADESSDEQNLSVTTTQEVKEMKVAISTKATQEPREAVNITSLFTGSRTSAQPAQRAESSFAQQRAFGESAARSVREGVGGLTSFVREGGDSYSKLRMCIIQRDETLELIAQRYALSISKIREVNHLASERIEEGQVLYIPQ